MMTKCLITRNNEKAKKPKKSQLSNKIIPPKYKSVGEKKGKVESKITTLCIS